MADWTKNEPSGSTTRRRWNLENRVSLNNLKSVLAEEGCPDVQYGLARDLLDTAVEHSSPSSKQQAVRWLVCAATKGQEDAAKLLRKCYMDGTGITAQNEEDVLNCLAMSPGERAARKAAHELFACLSQGSEHITPRQLERKMRKIYHLQRRRRHGCRHAPGSTDEDTESDQEESSAIEFAIMQTGAQNGHSEGITEANLVTAASTYAAGQLPAVSNALTLSVPHPASLDHLPRFHRCFFHPVLFFTLLYHRFINFVCSLPQSLPTSIRLCLLMLVYWLSSSDRNVSLLPLFTYYLSLLGMLWSTCKILKTKQQFIDFRIWSGLFLQYGDHNIQADSHEHCFLRNNMRPYLLFFCAFVCNLVVYPLVAEEWLPHSELAILSGAFVFCTLVSFMWSSSQGFPDWTVLVSFAVNVLAKYPYELDHVVIKDWRFMDVRMPTFVPFVIGHGIEFCLNCRAALYMLIPALLILLARRSKWHGSYAYLAPHCVTLCWLQICVNASRSATMFGAIRATLALAGLLLFLPLFGIVSLFIPVFVVIDWIGLTDMHLRWGSIAITTLVLCVIFCFMAKGSSTQHYVTALQISVGLAAMLALLYPHMVLHFKDGANVEDDVDAKIHTFDWQQYRSMCEIPNEYVANKVPTQLRCAHLNGMIVSWQGYVTDVRVVRVWNIREHLIANYLDPFFSNALRCWIGDYIEERTLCDGQSEATCLDWQQAITAVQAQAGQCTLQRWNSFEYEIKVRVGKLNSRIALRAGHEFGNFTRKLTKGDHVRFLGKLENSRLMDNHEQQDYLLGAAAVLPVKLASLECVSCVNRELTSLIVERLVKSPLKARLSALARGLKYLFNALLSPLFTIK